MPRQLLFAVLAVLNLDIVVGNCSFPIYATRYPRWETRMSLERYLIGAYWTFNQTTAEFTDLLMPKQKPFRYSCFLEVSSHVFLMKLQLQRDPNESPQQNDQSVGANYLKIYMCAQFFERSKNVMQLKLSELSLLAPQEILCGGNRSSWDDQILLWPRMERWETCPITGGFQFSMTDHTAGIKLCANSYLPPAFESECIEEEGISIDFRNFQCRGGLGMNINQRLFCLGNWVEENFTFSVITNQDEPWPKVWMLRSPIKMHDHFDVEILTNIKMVTTERVDLSTDHYTLHMTRTQFTSTCEDEAVHCDNCSNYNTIKYCQKSCDACPSSHPTSFSNTTIGSWLQVSGRGTQNVNISTSVMTVGKISFSHLSLDTKNWYKTKDRKALAITFSNGCRPRYLCADFVQKSDSILQYRLSQHVPWPHSLPMTADDLCNEDLFLESKTQLATIDKKGAYQYKAIVKNEEPPRSTTRCGFGRGHFHLTAHLPSGRNCKALLDSCKSESETSFQLFTSSDCDDGFKVEMEHHCLASFIDDTNEDLVVITEAGGMNAVYCWVLHKNEWESRPRLFFTYAADCNSEVIKYILYSNYTEYLAYFDIDAGPGLLGSYSCMEEISSLFNLSNTITPQISKIQDKPSASSTLQSTTPTQPKSVQENVQAPKHSSQINLGQPCMQTNIFVLLTVIFCVVSASI